MAERITLDLIRKRSEHNEGEIATLEEIALHQENIGKIELLDRACRDLKILLLQNNLIAKIENLGRLKRLEYLNLALNNIETIENLEGLESLKKLDLTVNFIGDLRDVRKLRCNENLTQLFLMGNPCADYDGYRDYVVAALPRLEELDGTAIERSERIRASQVRARIEGEIVRSYGGYERTRGNAGAISDGHRGDGECEQEENDDRFWKRVGPHTPEERAIIAERASRKEKRRQRERDDRDARPATAPKLFSPEGRPYNANQPKIPFALNTDSRDVVVLEVFVYKYLDTAYVDVDVQPEYVRVTIKGKILQLTLPCEVSVEGSKAVRNTTNGKLVVTMPRLDGPASSVVGARKPERNGNEELVREHRRGRIDRTEQRSSTTMREYLEIGSAVDRSMDFSRIVRPEDRRKIGRTSPDADTDRDDSDVPPLE